MGSLIEFNDTLQITTEQGFPKELAFEIHKKNPFVVKDFSKKIFSFEKPGARIFHTAPTRVFLVHNIKGKWLYWGHVHIIEQTIKEDKTVGKFKIIKIYDPAYQQQISRNETPKGKEFFK